MPRARTLVALVFVGLAIAAEAARADVVAERADLYAAYAAKLDELAAWCAEKGEAAAAETLKHWLPKRAPDQLTLFIIPPRPGEQPAGDVPEWRRRWQALRNQQADALMALAKRAVAEHRPSLVGELVVEAVRENPEHEAARAMLGYRRFQGAWHTPFEIRQLRAGKVWHDKFGWLPRAHVERYGRGERFALGRWMSAEEEAGLRGEMGRGWRVETEHYLVTTNHSLEEGVALAARLETLHAVWQQAFCGYLYSEPELARRLERRAAALPARQHNVVYYRTRDEYNRALKPSQPKIEMTLGIYFDTTRTAYFFAGEEQDPGTLYHEAAHQLFYESRGVAGEFARQHNFWIVEGIACYLESLAAHDGYCTLGGGGAGRMPAARHRLLVDNFYVPLAELVELGMHDLQQAPEIGKLYSQSAGLADFLVHDGQGRYRDALNRYLAAVYTNRATPRSLAELTAASYETLDRQYREFQTAGEAVARQESKSEGSGPQAE